MAERLLGDPGRVLPDREGTWMKFDPVFLPEDRRLGGRASQTFLKHFNGCPRSGFLYAKYKGEAQTVKMMRGSAGHRIFELATNAMVDAKQPTIPPELVKAIVDEVLADPEYPLPLEEHDYLREMSFRWASEWTVDPAYVVATETLFVLEIGGYQVRCKVDFAQLLEDGAALYIVDYKTGQGVHRYEDVARVMSDGRLMAKNFQLVLYALAMAFGVPVRIDPCPNCQLGGPVTPDYAASMVLGIPCAVCDDRRVVETPEPFSVASGVQRFDLEFVYPAVETREKVMLRRPMTLTRTDLHAYRASLEATLTRLAIAERDGDWPAVVSDSACGMCPASSECPIPPVLRDYLGAIDSPEQVESAASALDRGKSEHRKMQAVLRAYAKANGGRIRYGNKVWELVYSEHEEIKDKQVLWDAVERSLRTGEPFDRSEHVKTKGRTDFVARDITEEDEDA
jgi:hypothetical protein